MTESQFSAFCEFRTWYASWCKVLFDELVAELRPLQIEAAKIDSLDYPLENPVVYNSALDSVEKNDEIRIVLVGDNPGKDEQLSKNRAYLVGLSGKIAANFFVQNPELKIDFRKNVVILNKTPIHSAKTRHLRFICSKSPRIQTVIAESQIVMAQKTAELACALDCSLWLVGYSELKKNGIFAPYRTALLESFRGNEFERVRVFRHFSMNCFLKEVRSFEKNAPNEKTSEILEKIGQNHRKEIFGK